MIVVGFYKGHNATVCILRDGEIIAAVSEERFNRIKNADVFPIQAMNYCLKEAGIKAQDVDLYVRTYTHAEGFVTAEGETQMPRGLNLLLPLLLLARLMIFIFPPLIIVARFMYEFLYEKILSPYYQKQFRKTMASFLKINPNKIIFADHHTCHAFAGFYGFVPLEDRDKNYLVITLDGAGDGDCGGVWTVKNGVWKRISKTLAGNSIALFYGYITQYLGMKLNEHEYKVMGLAPYASKFEVDKVYPKFKGLFWTDENLAMHSRVMSGSLMHYFNNNLKKERFDSIAGAAQCYVEDIVEDLVKKAIKKTGINNLVVAGGFFMNVKVNKKISELKEIKKFIPCPSSSDESTVFGAAFYGYELYCKQNNIPFEPKKIKKLYLGSEFADKEIRIVINKKGNKYKIKKCKDIEKEIAKLLADGQIVARFNGKMEWGARALGNRSILMDPRRKDLVQKLNSQIKSRDFWMPFAASILDENEKKYLLNPKNIDARFMIIAFDTTDLGKKDLVAAIHPYDFSCRPQIVKNDDNPNYYKLIKYFKSITGVGAVLNTSFNYHGEPIVCSPDDALHTFKMTGLEYLALGNYLICKK